MMLPVYIICHADCEPGSYLCEYMDKHDIPYKKMNALKTDISTIDLESLSGLVFMGGPYSLIDECDWMQEEINLIHRAKDKNLPIMGVCFGAQLISKALGADVHVARYMETGWHQIDLEASALPEVESLSCDKSFEVFEWHEDTFLIPQGATPIFRGENFENQGYLLGNILAMQFHLEMTDEMVHEWLGRYEECLPEPSQYVQSPDQITDKLEERLEQLHLVADKIYGWWLAKLA